MIKRYKIFFHFGEKGKDLPDSFLGVQTKYYWAEPSAYPKGNTFPKFSFSVGQNEKKLGRAFSGLKENGHSSLFSGSPSKIKLGRASNGPKINTFSEAQTRKNWAEPLADPRGTDIPESIFRKPERDKIGQSLWQTQEERTFQNIFSGSLNEIKLGKASG